MVLFPLSSLAGEYKVVPCAAFGMAYEGTRSPNLYTKAGLKLRGPLYKEVKLEADVALSLYRITYYGLPRSIVVGGAKTVSPVAYPTDEKRYDYSGLLSYPFLKKKFQWDILAGYRGIHLSNDFSSFRLGGPLVGLSVGVPYRQGSVRLRGDVTPFLQQEIENHRRDLIPLMGSKSISVLGYPTVVTKYSLYWQAPRQKTWRFAIGYEGETMFFQGTQRYYNGVSIFFIF